jgi:hypothetical protein
MPLLKGRGDRPGLLGKVRDRRDDRQDDRGDQRDDRQDDRGDQRDDRQDDRGARPASPRARAAQVTRD